MSKVVFLQTMNMESETLETLGPSEFSFAITKVAVAQICQSAGFRAAQSSALETITRITTLYLQTLAKSASSRAASSGRTQSNIYDVVHALEHLSSDQGFAGASNPNGCLLASSPLLDLVKFVYSRCEIPFAKPLPRRSNLSQNLPLPQNPSNSKQSPHIPTWLPGFPDPSTYTEPKTEIPSGLNWNAEVEERKHSGNEMEKKSRLDNMELPKKRERVTFRMGEAAEAKGPRLGFRVGMKNGVCRGGKRVSWQNHNLQNSKFKRPR